MKEILQLIAEKFTINYETGEVTSNRTGKVYQGTDSYGYIQIRVGKKMMKGHQIVWLSFYGYLPEISIDHIDQDKLNNGIRNLRAADARLQALNKKPNDGIVPRKYRGHTRYRARIREPYGKQHEKTFHTYEEAKAWRQQKEIEYGYKS